MPTEQEVKDFAQENLFETFPDFLSKLQDRFPNETVSVKQIDNLNTVVDVDKIQVVVESVVNT